MSERHSLPEIIDRFRAEALERSPDGLHVDLGCGQKPYEGLLGIDFYADAPGILNVDLFDGDWGLELYEQTGKLIQFSFSSHFLEHTPDFAAFFRGLYDAMADGAVAVFLTPYWSSVRASQDFTHRQMISEARYLYLSKKWRESQGLSHYLDLDDVDFEPIGFVHHMHPDFAHLGEVQQKFAQDHYVNAVQDLVAVIRKCPPPSA